MRAIDIGLHVEEFVRNLLCNYVANSVESNPLSKDCSRSIGQEISGFYRTRHRQVEVTVSKLV
jgi:hypothetical protein